MFFITLRTVCRLLRASGQVLFRPVLECVADASEDEGAAPKTAQAIQERLHKAARGEWLALVEDCAREVESFVAAHQQDIAEPNTQEAGRISDEQLRRAALKSRHR